MLTQTLAVGSQRRDGFDDYFCSSKFLAAFNGIEPKLTGGAASAAGVDLGLAGEG